MSNYYKSKTFLVTGSSSGIGRATARALIEQGAVVGAMARRKDELESLHAELGDRLITLPGDVTDPSDCKKAVEALLHKTGRLDGVIHSAGVTMRGLAKDTVLDVYHKLMDVNYFGLVNLYKAAYPALTNPKSGKNEDDPGNSCCHFAAVSSLQGIFSSQYRSGYAAAKHAVQGFMDSVRIETLDENLHCLTVSPGFVQTDVSKNAFAADGGKHGVVDQAIANGLPPEEVARQILKAIRGRKRDIYPAGMKEMTGYLLHRISPALLDRVISKSEVT